jgi:hypothetical protein
MISVFNVAKFIDAINPEYADLVDRALYKFSQKKYNNPELDDDIENLSDDILEQSKYFSQEDKFDPDVPLNAAKYYADTTEFLVNYFAQTFIDKGATPEHALYNMLYFMSLLKIDPDDDMVPDILEAFKDRYLETDEYLNVDAKPIPLATSKVGHFNDLLHVYRFPYKKYLNISEEPAAVTPVKKTKPGSSVGKGIATIGTGIAAVETLSDSDSGFAPYNPTEAGNSLNYSSSGNLSIKDIAMLARKVGFSGDNLVKAVAIAWAESKGQPAAHNTNASTGDNSYGLWQINMIEHLNPANRRRNFGINSNEELFKPETNAKAAYVMSGGHNFTPWTTYKEGTYLQYVPEVKQQINKLF